LELFIIYVPRKLESPVLEFEFFSRFFVNLVYGFFRLLL
jgi:hypothetical protein